MRPITFAVHFCFVFVSAANAQLNSLAQDSSQGRLDIAVQDQAGKPIPSLSVFYTRLPILTSANGTLAPGEFHYSGTVPLETTAPTSVAVPPGKYLVCVQTGATAFLDVCKWATATSAVVTSSQATPVLITLTKGVRLNIAINDPQRLLAADRRPIGPPPVIVGVSFANGAYLGADCTAVAGEVTCSMAVPIGIPLNLRLLNPTLGFTSADGTAVDPSGIGPTFKSVGQDLQFNFSVSGSKLKGAL